MGGMQVWGGCPFNGIPTYIITYVNKEIINTNVNPKLN